MSAEVILSIDLGTIFSAVAYVNDYGKPKIIPKQEGEQTTPSVVYFQEDGAPIVGIEAKKLKSSAETMFPGVTKAVISVPAYFKDALVLPLARPEPLLGWT